MTADDQTRPTADGHAPGARLRRLGARVVRRAARPYLRLRAREAATAASLARLQADLDHTRERHGEQIARLEEFARELVLASESLRRDLAGVEETAAWARRTIEPIAAELRAAPYMERALFGSLATPVGEALGFVGGVELEGGDYASFEDVFRGSRERVADSQRAYLELVRGHAPVLDVGCGRGEFLALLEGAGIEASGVDSDRGMVARCRALGLEVVFGDANRHLEGLADGTLGTIFSAQVIEHMPHAELRRLFELARRKLEPGGLFIAETVNPHRISSLKTFWVDLTHQHPIFPEVALAWSAIAGFGAAFVFAPGFRSFETARFESPAYALVASVPGADPGTDAGGLADPGPPPEDR